MKKLITVLIMCLFCSVFGAKAQVVYSLGLEPSVASTLVADLRFEFIEAPTTSSMSLLVDKYTGRVWRYIHKRKMFEKVGRDESDVVDTTKVNYQLHISGSNSSLCFLLNVHTGDMWKYNSGKEGDKTFVRIDMPWDAKKEE